MIQLSVTQLEIFLQSPFKYRFPTGTTPQMEYGTKFHSLIESYVKNKTDENYELCQSKIEGEPNMIRNHLGLAENIPEQELTELYLRKYIECNGEVFKITGKIDLVHSDGTISDIKTSQGNRNGYIMRTKIQRIMYSWLRENNKKFIYYIFTKHKQPRFQEVVKDVLDIDSSEIMINKRLMKYLECYKKDERPMSL